MTEDEQVAVEREKKVITRRVRQYARQSGLRLNDDPKKLDALVTGMARRKVRQGDFYCPCRVLTGDREKDRGNVCPCDAHLREIAETGHCLCGLYFKAKEEETPEVRREGDRPGGRAGDSERIPP